MDQNAVDEMVATLHGAGVNFFDHSEAYGGSNRGAPEVMFGNAVRKLGIKRSDLVVSSKIFNHYNNVGLGPNEIGLSRKHLREGMEGILERLEMDYVDVVSAHRPDHLTPIEETVRGFNWLIDHGHALYWGTSNWTAQQLTEANEVAKRLDMVGPIAEQPPYSGAHPLDLSARTAAFALFRLCLSHQLGSLSFSLPPVVLSRTFVEDEYMPIYDQYGLGIMCYSPLAGGVLTGKYSALASEQADATSRYNRRGNLPTEQIETADKLRPFCEELGCEMAHLALAWALANPNISTLIAGATKLSQFESNMK